MFLQEHTPRRKKRILTDEPWASSDAWSIPVTALQHEALDKLYIIFFDLT